MKNGFIEDRISGKDCFMGDEMIYAELGTLRYRQINALSWRVASELSRRDPHLYMAPVENGSNSSQANELIMARAGIPKYSARRVGDGFTAGDRAPYRMSWDDALHMDSARTIAVDLEKSQGLELPAQSPATSSRALGYRGMASMVEMTLGDRQQWFTGSDGSGPIDPDSLPSRRLQPFDDTRWTLLRDDEPLATLDNFGWLEIGERRINLHSRYRDLNGRLYPLVLEIFAVLLP